MGGGSSKQILEEFIKQELTVKVSSYVETNCVSDANASQIINIYGNNNVIKEIQQKGGVQISNTCVLSKTLIDSIVSDLSATLIAKLKEDSTAFSDAIKGLLDSDSDQEIKTKFENIINVGFNSTTVNKCISSVIADQKINVIGNYNVVVGITQDELVKNISNCLFDVIEKSGIASTITGSTTGDRQDTDTTLTGIAGIFSSIGKAFSDFISGALYGWVPVALAFFLIIGIILYIIFRR